MLVLVFVVVSGPLRAQGVLSTLLGDSVGLTLNTGVLDLSVLVEKPESQGLLSADLLSGDGLLRVGVSGQDILLLGAPSQGVSIGMDTLAPLVDLIDTDQAAVIEFLEDTALSGDLEPTVLTVSLPGATISNQPEAKTADTRGDQLNSASAGSGTFSNRLQMAGACQDRDRDSVCDELDQCPDSPPNAVVLPSGCHFDPSRPLELKGVEFAVDTALLTEASTAILAQVVKILAKLDGQRVEVAGHTDDTGTEGYNLRLSRERSEAVRAFLISRGISPDRLAARGYGESQPKVSVDGLSGEALETARSRNRRVELRMIKSAESRK